MVMRLTVVCVCLCVHVRLCVHVCERKRLHPKKTSVLRHGAGGVCLHQHVARLRAAVHACDAYVMRVAVGRV